jgi:molybdenum cofactor cytidylyltransferase/nicotine blue oxidoreductase
MGAPKAELVVDGERLLDRAVRALRDGGCSPVHAVVRDSGMVAEASVVINPDPDQGQRSSLELGVAAASEVAAIAVLLVDMPGIGADAVRAVVQAWRPGRIAVGRIADHRVHPIVMAPSQWREALDMADADEGARRYLAAHPELVDEIEVHGSPQDLDTPDDVDDYRNATP